MAIDTTTNVVQYGSRTFGEIRVDLISLIRQMYPEILKDFTDSSVGAMLIDLNAGVGSNLSINTDRAFQETQLEYAQKSANILNIAKKEQGRTLFSWPRCRTTAKCWPLHMLHARCLPYPAGMKHLAWLLWRQALLEQTL